MEILLYNELDTQKIPHFDKFKAAIAIDDFKSIDAKKIGDNLYRARLNRSDRLLFSLYKHENKTYALILEFIKNHAYENSRFLRHVSEIDEDKIPDATFDENSAAPLIYLNPQQKNVNLLDKIISFDECQHAIYKLSPPLIIIGSAGSGKTALTLEKMKQTAGDVLYVTQSAYLVKNSRELYYAHHYENEYQQVDFLSFQEFIETIKVPTGKAITFSDFKQWVSRYRQGTILKDAHKLFEEFRGVLTGSIIDKKYLSREDYLNLGVKQSIFLQEERDVVYDLFEKYLQFLTENHFYDTNILSHDYLQHLTPRYDFVIVDEVQDLTNIQLYLILKSLRQINDFILCGDSNQIVHPNFFSWSQVKSLFFKQEELHQDKQIIRILNTNYRNAPQLTEIANRILKIKNLRFGSIDKESHYLITSNGHNAGEVLFLQDNPKIRSELDSKTKTSILFAVIVLNEEQKALARAHFNTPLVFTIQEAKGLEYENIILYNFLTQEETRYREIARGVAATDLQYDLKYARSKDKTDKSGEVYKFYINALYVALTRAIKNLYWIEGNPKQSLLELLDLREVRDSLELGKQNSSLDAWRQEARKLELQGKQEQADRIRSEILKQKTPPWQVIDLAKLHELSIQVNLHELDTMLEKNKKEACFALFEYALIYEEDKILAGLQKKDFKPAFNLKKGLEMLKQKHYAAYSFKKPDMLLKQVEQYGVEFRNPFSQTPLMAAAWEGNIEIVKALIQLGADKEAYDLHGLNAFQIALSQAVRDKHYAQKKFPEIYELLIPDSLRFNLYEHLVKLDNQRMEFFLVNMMIALLSKEKESSVAPLNLLNFAQLTEADYLELVAHSAESYYPKGFSTQSFLDAIQAIPVNVLSERYRKRTYLSHILSSNEIFRDYKYNKRVFYRTQHGFYSLNPALKINDIPIYQQLVANITGFALNHKLIAQLDQPELAKFHQADVVQKFNELNSQIPMAILKRISNLLHNLETHSK